MIGIPPRIRFTSFAPTAATHRNPRRSDPRRDCLPKLRRAFRTGARQRRGLSDGGWQPPAAARSADSSWSNNWVTAASGRSGRPRTRNSTGSWRSRFPATGNSIGRRRRSSSARPARPRNWRIRTSSNVHEVGLEGDLIYIVSDFVEGVSLADWLHRASGSRATRRPRSA